MKSKVKGFIVLIITVLLSFSFFGCNPAGNRSDKSNGVFLTLESAYDKGYITDDYLARIYDRYTNDKLEVNRSLDDKTVEMIKEDWVDWRNSVSDDLSKDDLLAVNDVFIYQYFGTYNEFVVLSLSLGAFVNEIAFEITVGDYAFYSPLTVMVWYPKDKDVNLYSFYDLCGREPLTADIISNVIIDSAPGSICPPWKHHVIENGDAEYIENVVSFLADLKLMRVDGTYDGIGYYHVTIVTVAGDFSFSYSNADEYYFDGKSYIALKSFPTEQVPGGDYYYIESVLTPTFKSFDTEVQLENGFIEKIKYQIAIKGPTLYPTYDLTKSARIKVGEEDELIIKSAKSFYYHNDLCLVIGDTDFSSLLDGITDETCKLTIASENGDTIAEFVISKNCVYTATEFLNKLYRDNALELRLESGEVFVEKAFDEDFTLTMIEKVVENATE